MHMRDIFEGKYWTRLIMIKVDTQLSMVLDLIITSFEKSFEQSYRIFDRYWIANFLSFAKGFEVAIVLRRR